MASRSEARRDAERRRRARGSNFDLGTILSSVYEFRIVVINTTKHLPTATTTLTKAEGEILRFQRCD